jgi:hypothetical protein
MITKVIVTGDLAFQAMALGKKSVARHWCMQCEASQLHFKDDCEMLPEKKTSWYVENKKRDPLLGVKKTMVAIHSFIQLCHSTPPLLNRDRESTVKKFASNSKWAHHNLLTGQRGNLYLDSCHKNITANMAKDGMSDEGGGQRILTHAVAVYKKRHEIFLANNNEKDKLTHINELINKLKWACHKLADQQLKLKAMQAAKGKQEDSVDRKLFKVLKEIRVD